MKATIILLIACLALASAAVAQGVQPGLASTTPPAGLLGVKPAASAFSLLDLSRVRWSNSYSVSYFSGGGTSGSAGLLNSTMFYDFSSKLSMSLNLGVLHNTAAIWGDGHSDAQLLPGVQLDYHPSDKFRMSLSIQTYSGYFLPYSRGAGYWRDPLFPY